MWFASSFLVLIGIASYGRYLILDNSRSAFFTRKLLEMQTGFGYGGAEGGEEGGREGGTYVGT